MTLYFAEVYEPTSRRFDVFLEGRRVLEGFDTFAPGFCVAQEPSFDLDVTGGFLEVELRPDPGKLSGIEIQLLDGLFPSRAPNPDRPR